MPTFGASKTAFGALDEVCKEGGYSWLFYLCSSGCIFGGQGASLELQIFDFSLQRCPLAPKNTPRGAQIKQPRIATLFTNLFQAYSWLFAMPNALQLKEKERKGGSEERISSQFGVPNALQLQKEPGRRCYGVALRFDRQRGG